MDNNLLIVDVIASNALDVFTGENNALNDFMANVEREALAHVPDVSTAKGRSEITANETKVKKAKLFVEKEGKALADRQKEIPKLIDASRKKSREFFEALQDKVRMPLTEWENEQKAIADKKAREEREEKERVESERLFSLAWDEAHFLNEKFDFDKEKAEIARAKKAEQDEKDRLAREAELIEQGRIAAELASKEALAKAEREKAEAEQREKQAIENARIEKERAEEAEKQRAIDEDNKRVAALAKAEQDRLQAIEDERKRGEAHNAKLAAIEAERAANVAHRTQVKTVVKNSLIDIGISEEQAVLIVKMACAGSLGAMTIKF